MTIQEMRSVWKENRVAFQAEHWDWCWCRCGGGSTCAHIRTDALCSNSGKSSRAACLQDPILQSAGRPVCWQYLRPAGVAKHNGGAWCGSAQEYRFAGTHTVLHLHLLCLSCSPCMRNRARGRARARSSLACHWSS